MKMALWGLIRQRLRVRQLLQTPVVMHCTSTMILYILRIVMMAQFIKLLIKGVGPLLLIGQRAEVLVIRHGRIRKVLMQLNHLAVGPLKSFILP